MNTCSYIFYIQYIVDYIKQIYRLHCTTQSFSQISHCVSVVYKKVLNSCAFYYKVPLADYILIYISAKKLLISMWCACVCVQNGITTNNKIIMKTFVP